MRGHISVRTLGTVAIEVGKRRLGPSSGRLFALLLYLASRRGHAMSRRVVQELLFPEANGHAAHNLRQLLYRLRQLGVPLDTDADQLSVRLEDVSLDWRRLVEMGPVGEADLEQLAQGVFPGYSPDVSDAFREWFEAERAEICLRLSRRLTRQITQHRADGRWDLVDAAARALLALDPLSEEGTLARAEVLAVAGSKSAALGMIDQYMIELGETQPHLRLAPSALRRRISERLPDVHHRALEDRLFVGREQTMRMLHALGTAARSGEQQILVLWGEPGIGKTRLLAEYRALVSLQGAVTVLFSCQSHDVYRPLGIACDMIAQLLQAPGALGCDPDARALLERLVSAKTVSPSAPAEPVAAEAPLSAIVRSLADLVGAVASECPVVAAVDDAQWLDEGSLRTLLGVFGDRTTRRSCLILASRERQLLAGGSHHTDSLASVRLNPLERDAALELTRTLLKPVAREGVEAIEQRVVEQARGNPFFIRLLCQHFVSTSDAQSLNQTLTELLERRLEQLSREATRTLEACVVLAKNCSFSRLEKVLEIPRHQLLRAIEELDDRGLIEVNDGFIVSSHALLSDAVQKRMAPTVKQMLHAAVAAVLQQDIDGANAGHLPWDCAEHWRLAGDDEQAISVLQTCAQRASEIGRPEDALETYKRALDLRCSPRIRLEILANAFKNIWYGLNFANARELLQQLWVVRTDLKLPTHVHDEYEILDFAQTLHSDRDPRVNIEPLRRCITEQSATLDHRIMAATQLVMIADLDRDIGLASFAFEHSYRLAPESFLGLIHHLVYETCFGDRERARKLATEMAANLSQYGKPNATRLVGILYDVGYAFYRVGDGRLARRYLTEALELAVRSEMIAAQVQILSGLSLLSWSAGAIDECHRWHGELRRFEAHRAVALAGCDYFIIGARLAIHDGRHTDASLITERGRRLPQAQLDCPRMQLLACQVSCRAADGQRACSESEFAELLEFHTRAIDLGEQDDIVLVLLSTLMARGEKIEAEKLLSEYMRRRREGAKAPETLRDFALRCDFAPYRNQPAPS